ncbi:hypothetical protein BDE36_1268 [Arcticibacter tournemirensis]|uniref:Uncharacterized protein n=1 Tax=Arcticibacter tournemirensis TaxID=699437 RepID=A0A5M9GGY7_9SPHI|nr:hypothetical protein [Arcticibacter tournemirensis]KAA8473883.1 hypothetical protein F1649_22545 [Arcticibacter tournemirensis]TQM49551.1 hypothetical protein BDE36_1268 [Arcticibacter tournemirensis]
MKACSSIRFKAALLTFVFLLNTIVGFACAVGTDMGFNSGHHIEQKAVHSSEHTDKHNKPHTHGKHTHSRHAHSKHNHGKHKHDKDAANHHTSKSSKDNCCKDEVAKLTKADKLIQPGFDYSLLSLSTFILPSPVYGMGNSGILLVNVPNAYFVKHCRPPISDVRIAIQSFQI